MDESKLDPKIILALETSSKLCSVALWDKNNKIIGHIDHIGAKVHNEHLLPSIQHLLDENNLSLSDLDGIAIGVGPGSFTGLRIGCAAVQGLALSLEIPIFTCSSLRIMSQDFILKNIKNIKNINNKICVILDANAGDYYIGEYIIKNNIAENINPDFLLNKKDLVSYFKNNNFDYYIGDICLDNLDLNLDLNLNLNNAPSPIPSPIPSSIALCELFCDILKNPIGPEDLEPVYLRTQRYWEK